MRGSEGFFLLESPLDKGWGWEVARRVEGGPLGEMRRRLGVEDGVVGFGM